MFAPEPAGQVSSFFVCQAHRILAVPCGDLLLPALSSAFCSSDMRAQLLVCLQLACTE